MECLEWLDGLGNGQINTYTKKKPREMFKTEYGKLIKVYEKKNTDIVVLTPRNTVIKYMHNRYKLPENIVANDSRVRVERYDDTLLVYHALTNDLICKFKIPDGTGNVVSLPTQAKSLSIEEEMHLYYKDDETVSNLDYLYNILKQGVDIRKRNKITNHLKESRLPKKVFEDTRITQGLKWQLGEIGKIDFKNTNQNIVIVGDVATGKTSLATYIATNAIQKGAKAIYFTEEDFIAAHKTQKTLRNRIQQSDLIVLDELFYLTPTDENLVYLYKTIMFLSESRSVIFVTNRPMSEWENMNVDTHIVSTFRQRIMTNAQLIHLG